MPNCDLPCSGRDIVRERLRSPPPQALGWHYVICQTTAPGRAIGVATNEDVQSFFGDIDDELSPAVLLALGDTMSQFMPQAVATDVQSIAVAPTVEVEPELCDLNKRSHALTQGGVTGNMAGLQQRQKVVVEGLVVPAEWRVDHYYILLPYSPFFTRYEWESDGAAAVFPRRLRM
uniref:Tudor domain-containing protein n=1 Tax=Globodera pallida TaxID=36090 RepID=A0A183C6C1_GLOPA